MKIAGAEADLTSGDDSRSSRSPSAGKMGRPVSLNANSRVTNRDRQLQDSTKALGGRMSIRELLESSQRVISGNRTVIGKGAFR